MARRGGARGARLSFNAAPHGTLAARVRALPPAAWALFAGTFLNRFGQFVLVFLVLWLVSKGYSPARAGLAASLYGAGSIVAALAGGHLADRIGRRAAIAISMFASAAAMLALSRATTLATILPLVFLTGLTAELYRPAAMALLADLTPPGERVTAFAVYRLAVNLGTGAGPAVAGFLAERSFTLLFVGDAVTSVLYAIVALVMLPGGRPPRSVSSPEEGATRLVLRDRQFVRLLAGTALASVVFHQAYTTLPLHIAANGFTPRVYGLLMAVNGLLIVAFELPLTSITGRAQPHRAIALGFLLAGAGFGLTGVSTTVALLAISIVVWTFGEMISLPIAPAWVADLAPPHARGRYQAAFTFAFAIGTTLAPALGAALFAHNPAALWAGCALTGLAAAWLVVSGRVGRG